MQKTIGVLAALLAAQLMLAIGMSFTAPDLRAHRPDTPLLALGDGTVDRLTIDGPDDQGVALLRRGDGWVLPGSGDFPADGDRVDRLLERLGGLQRGLAVATTPGALRRFKVSGDEFERRLVLARGDEPLATLYLGTSPGLRRVHARTDRDDAVYSVELGIHDAPVKPGDWEDKGVLRLPAGEIETIGLGELTLSRAPGDGAAAPADDGGDRMRGRPPWQAEGLEEGETVDQTGADALAQKLATLTFGSILGREASPGYGLERPALMVSVQRTGGGTLDYRLGRREPENDYVLKVSARPEYFRLPAYSAEALIEAAGRARLVTPPAGGGDTAEPGPAADPSPLPPEATEAPAGAETGGDAS